MDTNDYQFHIHEPKDQSSEYFKAMDLKYKRLYEWQNKAVYKATKVDKNGMKSIVRFLAIQAPCGCGKTTALVGLGISDIIYSNYKQKQLTIVPQGHVGLGFSQEGDIGYISIELKDAKGKWKKYQWNILAKHNYCSSQKIDKSKTRALKKWLLTSPEKLAKHCSEGVISGLNAVCCYQSLVIVWKQLTSEQKKRAITHLSLIIDEAHHLKHIFFEETDFESIEEKLLAEKEATEIGKICTYILNSNIRSSKIRTTSATMYRGDRKFIFSESVKKAFIYFTYSWAEHFKTLGIDDFKFSYEEYEENPIEQMIENIFKEPDESHFVVFPATGNKWRRTETKELKLFISLLEKRGIPREAICDLVTKNTQSKNKEMLLLEPKKLDPDNPPKFKVVIVCRLGREGTDWCPCTRIHNGSHERTLTLAMQTLGRLLRRYKGKKQIIATTYVKEFTAIGDITNRELLSDRTNALLLCMQLDDNFRPIFFPIIPPGEKKESKKRESISLEEYLGDAYQDIKIEMLGRYDGIGDKTDEAIRGMLYNLLEEYDIDDNVDIVVDALFTKVVRIAINRNDISVPDFEGITVDFIRKGGYDIIKKHMKQSTYFGNCSKEDFPEIQRIITEFLGMFEYNTLDEIVAWVEKMGFKDMAEYNEWLVSRELVEARKNREKKVVVNE